MNVPMGEETRWFHLRRGMSSPKTWDFQPQQSYVFHGHEQESLGTYIKIILLGWLVPKKRVDIDLEVVFLANGALNLRVEFSSCLVRWKNTLLLNDGISRDVSKLGNSFYEISASWT